MKESIYKTYDELPLFLNAGTVARVLGKPTHPCWQNNQRYRISYREVLHSLGYVSRK